jgi:hypothetical protein
LYGPDLSRPDLSIDSSIMINHMNYKYFDSPLIHFIGEIFVRLRFLDQSMDKSGRDKSGPYKLYQP